MIKFAVILILAIGFTLGTVAQFDQLAHHDHCATASESPTNCDPVHSHHCCLHSHFAYTFENDLSIKGFDNFEIFYMELQQKVKPNPDLEGPFQPPRC